MSPSAVLAASGLGARWACLGCRDDIAVCDWKVLRKGSR